jgi:hypothetical protein
VVDQSDGTAALAALNRALAAKPVHDGTAFVDATENLCAMRRKLIVQCRAGSDRRELLFQLNGILSSALSGHFPLGPIPWPLIEQARASLATIMERDTDLL